jgi:hypothetical protein
MALAMSGMSLIGGIMQSRSQADQAQQQANAQRQAAAGNIVIAQGEAKIIAASRQLSKSRERKALSQFISHQRVTFAKAGVTGEGSPIRVIEETLAAGELDIIIGDINASIQQDRLLSEINQHQVSSAEAGGIEAAGKTRAGLTLLTSISKFGSNFVTSGSNAATGGGTGGGMVSPITAGQVGGGFIQ